MVQGFHLLLIKPLWVINLPPLYIQWTFYMVGVAGFEPAASCSQSRPSDRTDLHPEFDLVEGRGIEPLTQPCKGHVFPLAPTPQNSSSKNSYQCYHSQCCEYYQCGHINLLIGASGGTRTHMPKRRVLSPLSFPISPHSPYCYDSSLSLARGCRCRLRS